jgi:hypothetical protein
MFEQKQLWQHDHQCDSSAPFQYTHMNQTNGRPKRAARVRRACRTLRDSTSTVRQTPFVFVSIQSPAKTQVRMFRGVFFEISSHTSCFSTAFSELWNL